MGIIYVDPGYGRGFSYVTTTAKPTNTYSTVYNPYSSICFTSTGKTYFKFSDGVKSLPSKGIAKTISLKFSIYVGYTSSSDETFKVGIHNKSTANAIPDTGNYSCYLSLSNIQGCRFTAPSNNDPLSPMTAMIKSPFSFGVHDIIFCVQVCASNTTPVTYSRTIACIVDDTSGQFVCNSGMDSADPFGPSFSFLFPSFACYVSNVIIGVQSEEALTKPTNVTPIFKTSYAVVALPLKNTSGDFISGENGEYIGNTAGQQLLSTIDAQDVIEKFGATSKVVYLVTCGNPGYSTDSGITTAHGLFEEGEVFVDGGSHKLSSDTTATIFDSKEMTDTTLADIDGKRIGWRV